MQCTDNMIANFHLIFNEKTCNDLAHEHRFVQRSTSKLKGDEFIKLFTLPCEGLSEDSLDGLCERLQKLNPDANLSSPALAQRINTPYASNMMKACFQKILQYSRLKIQKQYTSLEGALKEFNNVFIQDSTVCALNENLQKFYKGTRKSCKSQLKIDLIHNFAEGRICDALICSGNVPDQGLSERIIKFIHAGDIVIRDLGYFNLKVFKQIDMNNAFYLSRMLSHVKVFLNLDEKEPIDLANHFHKHYRKQQVIDITVYIGAEKLKTRLVAYRMPKDEINKRLREANKRARATGRTLSHAKKTLLKFSLFITNAPCERLSTNIIGTVYRLRWEIELIFKQWKSLLKIDVLKGINKHRIECLMWGRLCMVLLVSMICGHFMNLANRLCSSEMSSDKLIKYLMRDSKLFNAMARYQMDELLNEAVEDMPRRFLKNKRSRTTARERVTNLETYYGWDA